MSEPGLCSGEKESDLLSSHQRRENPGGGDPHHERAALQEEGLSVHSAVHFPGAGEGALLFLTLQKKCLHCKVALLCKVSELDLHYERLVK